MYPISDLQLAADKFQPHAISEQTRKFNDGLMKMMNAGPQWYEVGAEKYREMRRNGETPMPKPNVVEDATNIKLPSREPGRTIPCRVFRPKSQAAKGVFYHIHGGGWVLGAEGYQDLMLQYYADHARLIVVSVGYRLAPEHPYPSPNEDCSDIGTYLVDNAPKDFDVPLLFVGGDSAGANLSVLTTFHLLQTRPHFAFRGLVLNFGAYDLSGYLPQVHHFDMPLVLDAAIMKRFITYLPEKTPEQRRDPSISPFFANLNTMKLPPALFVCGTLDVLLDDSTMMATKWAMSGAESILKIYPGAAHNFTVFPIGGTEQTEKALQDIAAFLNGKL